ncbi:MAG: hypothetical protein U0637_04935 [Phycisphaerales bacterium]
MPIYEYEAREDGKVIELMRPMSQADAPVEDPDGKGRTFVRRMSTFAPKGGSTSHGVAWGGGGGGCCPCGKGKGACSGGA